MLLNLVWSPDLSVMAIISACVRVRVHAQELRLYNQNIDDTKAALLAEILTLFQNLKESRLD